MKKTAGSMLRIIKYKKEGAEEYESKEIEYKEIQGEEEGEKERNETIKIGDIRKGQYEMYIESYDVAGNKTESNK